MNQMGKNEDLAQKTIMVVGDGIAALCCLHFLAEKKTESAKLIQVAPTQLIPICSERDLVFVSNWGKSAEREELPGAVEWSWGFYHRYYSQHTQVFKHHFLARPKGEEEKIALGIYPRSLLKQMRADLAHQVEKFDDLVVALSPRVDSGLWRVQTHKEQQFNVDKIILCTGAFDFLLQDFGIVTVQGINGSYVGWHMQGEEWPESFILSHAGHNVAYDRPAKKLWMGGTRDALGHLWPRHDLIKKMQESFVQHWDGPLSFISRSPDFVSTGVRPKFSKGVANSQAIEKYPGLYYLNGLYKNGFSYTPFLANDLATEVLR